MNRRIILLVRFYAALMLAPLAAYANEHGAEHHAGHDQTIHWTELAGQTVTFLVFFGGLVVFLKKPLSVLFLKRHQTIKQALYEARLAQEKAQEKLNEYQIKMNNLDQEIATLKTQLQQSMQEEQKRIEQQAQAAALRLQQEAEQTIRLELFRAQEEIRHETIAQAVAIAEQSLSRDLTQTSAQQQLVQQFIHDLASLKRGTAV